MREAASRALKDEEMRHSPTTDIPPGNKSQTCTEHDYSPPKHCMHLTWCAWSSTHQSSNGYPNQHKELGVTFILKGKTNCSDQWNQQIQESVQSTTRNRSWVLSENNF